jgi:hypothetical protein
VRPTTTTVFISEPRSHTGYAPPETPIDGADWISDSLLSVKAKEEHLPFERKERRYRNAHLISS